MCDEDGWVSESGLTSRRSAKISGEPTLQPEATVRLYVYGPSSMQVEARWSFRSATFDLEERKALIAAALAALTEMGDMMP